MAHDSEIDPDTGKARVTSEGKFFGWNNKIYGRAGEHATLYMRRFWFGRLRLHIFYRGDADHDPHDHPWDFITFPLVSYVEEVTVQEQDFFTVSGFVGIEGTTRRFRQVVPAFRFTHRAATHCHRVLGAYSGKCWSDEEVDYIEGVSPRLANRDDDLEPYHHKGKIITFVWRSKTKRPWGFLKNRDGRWCWVHWREYVFGGGKDAACL